MRIWCLHWPLEILLGQDVLDEIEDISAPIDPCVYWPYRPRIEVHRLAMVVIIQEPDLVYDLGVAARENLRKLYTVPSKCIAQLSKVGHLKQATNDRHPRLVTHHQYCHQVMTNG